MILQNNFSWLVGFIQEPNKEKDYFVLVIFRAN